MNCPPVSIVRESFMEMHYWDERYKKGGFEWGDEHTPVAELARDIMEKKKFTRVLDVGCGYGRDGIYLARKGFDVVGIDLSGEALRLARNWANREGLRIDFREMDITRNSFEDSCFDTVIMFNTFHFMVETVRERAISETYRILRNGGVVVQAIFSTRERGFGQGIEVERNTFEFKPGRPVHFFSESEIRNAFAKFTIVRLDEVDIHEVHQGGKEHFHREWLMVAGKT
jgi:SAM-dependent methyltransferase